MAGPPYLGEEHIRRMLPMEHAVMALEAVFRAGPPAADAPGARARLGGGTLDVDVDVDVDMDIDVDVDVDVGEHGSWAGARFGETVFALFDAADLRPRLLIDAHALAVLRAAAASALATQHPARADAGAIVVFGAGPHARAHVRAMLSVRQPAEVRIVAPDGRRARRVAEELAAEHGVDVTCGGPGDVAGADIVCACVPGPLFTGPLFAGSLFTGPLLTGRRAPEPPPGAHVNTIDAAGHAAGWRAFVVAERGDDPGVDTDLHRVLTGQGTPPGAPTLFKSAGLVAEDLVLAIELAAKVLD